jgi:hypothetical protein
MELGFLVRRTPVVYSFIATGTKKKKKSHTQETENKEHRGKKDHGQGAPWGKRRRVSAAAPPKRKLLTWLLLFFYRVFGRFVTRGVQKRDKTKSRNFFRSRQKKQLPTCVTFFTAPLATANRDPKEGPTGANFCLFLVLWLVRI